MYDYLLFLYYNDVHFLIFTHSFVPIHLHKNKRIIWHGIDDYEHNTCKNKNIDAKDRDKDKE